MNIQEIIDANKDAGKDIVIAKLVIEAGLSQADASKAWREANSAPSKISQLNEFFLMNPSASSDEITAKGKDLGLKPSTIAAHKGTYKLALFLAESIKTDLLVSFSQAMEENKVSKKAIDAVMASLNPQEVLVENK